MTPRTDQATSALGADIPLPSLDELEPEIAEILDDLDRARASADTLLARRPAPPPPTDVEAEPAGGSPVAEIRDRAPAASSTAPPVSEVPVGIRPALARTPEARGEHAEPLDAPPGGPSPAPPPTMVRPTVVAQTSTQRVPAGWLAELVGGSVTRRRISAAILAAAALAAGVLTLVDPAGSSADGPRRAEPAPVVDQTLVRVATATRPLVDVYSRPDTATVIATLAHPTPSGGALVFPVQSEWEGWLRVRMPTDPAAVGWVRGEHVELTEHRIRIEVDLTARQLTVRDGEGVARRVPIAVGRFDAPEPGSSFVTQALALGNPNGVYGSHALALAGHPATADRLFRGDGVVALHGTNDPALIGQETDTGSVAVSDVDVAWLAAHVPAGTPVEITAPPAAADNTASPEALAP